MKLTTLVALLLLSSQCVADTLKSSLQRIESEWASIYYRAPDQSKKSAYQQLLDKTIQLSRQFPNEAEPVAWQAILKATQAEHLDAMNALKAINDAKNLLLTAIQMNPRTMEGSAYVTLGTLYFMAPKWPIAFGDNEKAKEMLETALKINPNGIDANYYFGEFLLSEGRFGEAIKHLEKAAKAPARKEQLFADNQLKTEAAIAIKKAMNQQQTRKNDLFLSFFDADTVK